MTLAFIVKVPVPPELTVTEIQAIEDFIKQALFDAYGEVEVNAWSNSKTKLQKLIVPVPN